MNGEWYGWVVSVEPPDTIVAQVEDMMDVSNSREEWTFNDKTALERKPGECFHLKISDSSGIWDLKWI
jgi:hypothetical protein